MKEKFKILLSNVNFYKEISLEKYKKLYIGNKDDCDVIINMAGIQEPFSLFLYMDGDKWNLECDSNTYVAAEGVLKQFGTIQV